VAWGDRKNSRVSFEHPIDTMLMGIDGTWRRDCKLVDVSGSGARLIASGSLEGLNLKEFFLLLTPSGGAYRRCELVRIDGEEIGVRFLKTRSKPTQREGDHTGKGDGPGKRPGSPLSRRVSTG
jgi:PilZ domain